MRGVGRVRQGPSVCQSQVRNSISLVLPALSVRPVLPTNCVPKRS